MVKGTTVRGLILVSNSLMTWPSWTRTQPIWMIREPVLTLVPVVSKSTTAYTGPRRFFFAKLTIPSFLKFFYRLYYTLPRRQDKYLDFTCG